LNQCVHYIFSDKGEGVNFSRFCADVFYGRTLTVSFNSEVLNVFKCIYIINFKIQF